jgi:hypothetical protein
LTKDGSTSGAAAVPITITNGKTIEVVVHAIVDEIDARPGAVGDVVRVAIAGVDDVDVLTVPEYRRLAAQALLKNRPATDIVYEANRTLTWSDATVDDPENTFDIQNVKTSGLTEDTATILTLNGMMRLDTVLVRNLIFIVNLYRSVRAKLHSDLVYDREIVIKSAPITNARLTEFFGNQQQTETKAKTRDGFRYVR